MPSQADAIVARARALVGTRFLAQGRSPAEGVDCIGLVALAIGARNAPRDYALRGGSARRLAEELAAAGLSPVGSASAGDVLVLSPGPGQLHLGLFTGTGLIHGDAGLRRVVERPLPLPWPVLGIWRY
ncbi:MAG TPA: peptidoglycan endopeptidase [Allosphingosinicella sp.]|nr:peptidoglycan endopeptidase [Allosphingosinicella sp.]